MSPRPAPRRGRWLPALWVGAAGSGLALLAVAAARYPGGTWCDRARVGHDLLGNYWCDLLHARALGGQPNPGVGLASVGFGALLVALAAWFHGVAALRTATPRLAWLLRGAGTLAVLGGVAVPLLPSDRFGAWHGVAVVGAGLPGLTALALAAASAFPARASHAERVLGVLTLALTALDLALYVRGQARPAECSVAVPALQKLATLLLVAWMAEGARQAWTRA